MYETNYHRASSVADAVKLLKKSEDPKILAGGMTLIPTMKQRLASPSDLGGHHKNQGIVGRESVRQDCHHRRGDNAL